MSFWSFFSRQAGNPSGWFGRWVMPLVFDRGNSELNEMMKGLLEASPGDRILEIGCGTGKLIRELSAIITSGKIDGVEISETMATMARARNATAVAEGGSPSTWATSTSWSSQGRPTTPCARATPSTSGTIRCER